MVNRDYKFYFNKVWGNRSYRFLILFVSLYLIFYYFNIFFMGITAPGGFYSLFLDLHLNYIRGLRKLLIETSAYIIRSWDYELYTTPMRLHVDGRSGIVLVYSCLGYGIMSAFAAFVIAWPGKSLKSKAIFLIGGLIMIQVLNITRIISLALLGKKFPLYHHLDHHDTFNIIVYLALIGMVYGWLGKGGREF
jgi:exosortase/archaeosortase family protein